MEQPCYKCGQAVEEGVPFCPHCSAPQIRVIIAESVSAPAIAGDIPAALPQSAALPAPQTVPIFALAMSWSETVKPCALAALVATLLMSVGLNPFVAMVAVGFLAVVFYRQRRPGTMIKAVTGARIGALSGLLWFAMSSLLEALVVLFLHRDSEIRKGLIAIIEQAASRTGDPQVLVALDRLKTPEGLQFLIIFGLVSGFVAAIVLAAIGGALGGTVLSRRGKT